MKKSFTKLYLIAALVLTTGLAFVGCKDYDDDIDNLQKQITENAAAIKKVQDLIDGGSVITNVASTTNGIVITLSNGATHTITNGTNGTNGTDGTVVSIGLDGYWYIGTTKTEYQAHGATGDTGAIGETGANGKNGDYYIPEADGYWYKVDGETGTKTNTNISWAVAQDGAITAAWDAENGILTLMGVPGYADGLALVIYNNSALLRSLVFVPQVSVNGVSSIDFSDFRYSPLSKTTDNVVSATAKPNTITPAVIAEYHMNPTTAKEDYLDLENLEFVYKGVATYSSNIDATVTSKEIKNGLLRVGVKVNSAYIDNYRENRSNTNPSSITNLDLIALQVPVNEDGDNVNEGIVTSDYAGLWVSTIENVKIVQPYDAKGSHNGVKNIGTVDNCYEYYIYLNQPRANAAGASTPADENVQTLNYNTIGSGEAWDAELVYDKSLDLRELVAARYITNCGEFDLDKYNMEFRFEIPYTGTGGTGIADDKYIITNTDQQEFAYMDGDYTLKARTFGITNPTQSSIGRTPVVRVILYDKDNGAFVKIAYIKIKIVREKITPDPITIEMAKFYHIACDDLTLETTIKQMNELIYAKVDMEKEEFHSVYKTFTLDVLSDGVVIEKQIPTGQETTYTLEWTLDHLLNIGKIASPKTSYTATATYSSNLSNYGDVVITLKAEMIRIDTGIKMAIKQTGDGSQWYDYSAAEEAISNVITDGTSDYAKYTTEEPQNASDVAASCTFLNKSLADLWNHPVGSEVITLIFPEYIYSDGKHGGYATTYSSLTNAQYVSNFWGIYATSTFITSPYLSLNAEIKYRFAATQPGTPITGYTLGVNSTDPTQLDVRYNGTDYAIAKITNTFSGTKSVGVLTYYNGTGDYPSSNLATQPVALKMLNNMKDQLFANVETYVETGCNEIVTIENGKYTVQFARPLTINPVTDKVFNHGDDNNNNKLYVLDVVKLTDHYGRAVGKWNGTAYVYDYWNFYDLDSTDPVRSITLDVNNVTTTRDYGTLPDRITVKYEADGYLYYESNGASQISTSYVLNVPVIIKYLWGEVSETVKITVNPYGR